MLFNVLKTRCKRGFVQMNDSSLKKKHVFFDRSKYEHPNYKVDTLHKIRWQLFCACVGQVWLWAEPAPKWVAELAPDRQFQNMWGRFGYGPNLPRSKWPK